jgi:hypothetical protein
VKLLPLTWPGVEGVVERDDQVGGVVNRVLVVLEVENG